MRVKGRITYTATEETPARSPYHAPALYLLASPWKKTHSIGDLVDVFLDMGYSSSAPKYKDDRTVAESSSGIAVVRHFLSGNSHRVSLSWVDEVYSIEYVQNGTFGADALYTKGPEWTIIQGSAECAGTQVAASDLINAGVVSSGGVVKVTFRLSGVTAGGITPVVGGVAGTLRTVDGVYTEDITSGVSGVLSLQANSTFVGNVQDYSVKSTGEVSDYAVMNALNLEVAKGTLMRWWPNYVERPSDYLMVLGNKRLEPKRLPDQFKWSFNFDLKVLPSVQVPSSIPAFEVA